MLSKRLAHLMFLIACCFVSLGGSGLRVSTQIRSEGFSTTTLGALLPAAFALWALWSIGREVRRELQKRLNELESPNCKRRPAASHLLNSFPKLWELFSFVLPGQAQREAFEPAYNDLLKDYLRAMKFSGKWARRWLAFAFTVRTLLMVLDCFRVMLQSAAGKILLNFLPDALRSWWRRQ